MGMRHPAISTQGTKRNLLENKNPPSSMNVTTNLLETSPTPSKMSPPKRNLIQQYPVARDGHAAVIYYGCLWIFGGDRHHMPFNDLQILPLLNYTRATPDTPKIEPHEETKEEPAENEFSAVKEKETNAESEIKIEQN